MKYSIGWFFALLFMSILNFAFGLGYITGETSTHNMVTGSMCAVASVVALLIHFKVIE